MNILDENIPKPQRELLEGRRISVRQVGVHNGFIITPLAYTFELEACSLVLS